MDMKTLEFNGILLKNIIETKEVTVGDTILFTEDVYSKNYFNSKIIGKRTILAKVYKENYGQKYITFSLLVLEAQGYNADELKEKKYIRKREYNLLSKYKVYRTFWNNEINRCYLIDSQRVYKYNLKHNKNTINNNIMIKEA